MSWDVFVQDLPRGITSADDISDDFEPAPLGSPEELISRIVALFPEADFSDRAYGIIEAPDFSIEVDLGEDDPVTSFALNVRGGDSAPFAVAHMLSGLGLGALDPQSDTGLFALDEGSLQGFEKWRRFRDRVVRGEGA